MSFIGVPRIAALKVSDEDIDTDPTTACSTAEGTLSMTKTRITIMLARSMWSPSSGSSSAISKTDNKAPQNRAVNSLNTRPTARFM